VRGKSEGTQQNQKCCLAKTNAIEDLEDDVMDDANPQQRLSTAIQKYHYTELEGGSNNEEPFNFLEVNDMLDSSDSEEPVQETVVSLGNISLL